MPCDVCEGWEDRCASCKFNAKIDDARAEGAAAERDRVVAELRRIADHYCMHGVICHACFTRIEAETIAKVVARLRAEAKRMGEK